ncbi:ethanolamine utilization protein EutQ [Klebsiella michiganensis]|nr:ethanolamine utilization protein EutQ [Klebsiella michiganensis]
MKKLITANDIRAAHARGEEEISVVLRASIITPEAREVAELLGVAIQECDESAPEPAVPAAEEKNRKPAHSRNHYRAAAGRAVYRKAWWRS